MSKAAELAALIGSQTALSNRNLIINGAMQVAQRGTSSTSEGYHTIDRWRVGFSGGAGSLSQQELTLGQTDLPRQFRYFARLSVTTGADFAGSQHRIEGVDVVSDEKVTLSFYAKGTNPGGGSVRVSLRQIFGSGGSSGVDVTDQFITLTSSWQRFELTYDIPSLSGKTIGTSSYLQVKFGQGSDTSTNAWTIDFTGVQLEVGEQATPFEHRSFGDELARCKRYFERWTPDSNSHGITVAHAYSTGQAQLTFPFSEKRAAPTYSVSGNANLRNASGDSATASLVSSHAGKQSIFLTYSRGSGLSAGNASMFRLAASGYLDLDAEL